MNDDDIVPGGDPQSPTAPRRRRGGVTGMVLAELRELAGSLGVDTTGLRRGDLITEIRRIQATQLVSGSQVRDVSVGDTMTTVETIDRGDGRIEERVVTFTTVDSTMPTDEPNAEFIKVGSISLSDPGDGERDGAGQELTAMGPPPPARLLSLLSLLLAPGERENWLGELHTARWELRAAPRARRRETWGYFQSLGKSLVASWRYRGDGPTREAS